MLGQEKQKSNSFHKTLGQTMKLKELLSEETLQYEVKRIKNSDRDELQKFADFYNQSGQLSWTLTPQKIIQKLGSKGRIWGLYIKGTSDLVGTIGIKDLSVGEQDMGEIGYVMVSPEHRSLQNLMMMFKEVIRYSRKFDDVFATTNTNNRPINVLLDRTGKADKILKIRSPYSRNLLFVWNINTSRSGDNTQALVAHFKQHILMEL